MAVVEWPENKMNETDCWVAARGERIEVHEGRGEWEGRDLPGEQEFQVGEWDLREGKGGGRWLFVRHSLLAGWLAG